MWAFSQLIAAIFNYCIDRVCYAALIAIMTTAIIIKFA